MVSGFFAPHVKLLVRIIIDPSTGHPNLETHDIPVKRGL